METAAMIIGTITPTRFHLFNSPTSYNYCVIRYKYFCILCVIPQINEICKASFSQLARRKTHLDLILGLSWSLSRYLFVYCWLIPHKPVLELCRYQHHENCRIYPVVLVRFLKLKLPFPAWKMGTPAIYSWAHGMEESSVLTRFYSLTGPPTV